MREPLGELALLKAGMSSAEKLWQAVYWFTYNHRGHNAYLMDPAAPEHAGPEARSSYSTSSICTTSARPCGSSSAWTPRNGS